MLQQFRIRSRIGNVLIEILGGLFAVASTALLVYYVVTLWEASSLLDHALQLVLLIGAGAGVVFVLIGRDNLRQRPS